MIIALFTDDRVTLQKVRTHWTIVHVSLVKYVWDLDDTVRPQSRISDRGKGCS